MKKSEFIKRYRETLNQVSHEEAAELAELAGVKWDPEALPERIQYAQSEHLPALRALCPVPEGWDSEDQAAATYREAVRRYNAWEALRKEVADLFPPGTKMLNKLLSILDGKESRS